MTIAITTADPTIIPKTTITVVTVSAIGSSFLPNVGSTISLLATSVIGSVDLCVLFGSVTAGVSMALTLVGVDVELVIFRVLGAGAGEEKIHGMQGCQKD